MTIFYAILMLVCLAYIYFVVKAFAQEKPKKIDEILAVLGVVTITWGIISIFIGGLLCVAIGMPVSQRYGTWELIGRSDPVEIFAFKTNEQDPDVHYYSRESRGKETVCVFVTKNKMGALQKTESPDALTSLYEYTQPAVQMAQYKHNPPAWLGMGRFFASNDMLKTELFIPKQR